MGAMDLPPDVIERRSRFVQGLPSEHARLKQWIAEGNTEKVIERLKEQRHEYGTLFVEGARNEEVWLKVRSFFQWIMEALPNEKTARQLYDSL